MTVMDNIKKLCGSTLDEIKVSPALKGGKMLTAKESEFLDNCLKGKSDEIAQAVRSKAKAINYKPAKKTGGNILKLFIHNK